MICPNCSTQMHQKVLNHEPCGSGISTDEYYETWTIQVCPQCGREVKEFYSVELWKKGGEKR